MRYKGALASVLLLVLTSRAGGSNPKRLRDRDSRVEASIKEAGRRLAVERCGAGLLEHFSLTAPDKPLPEYVDGLLYIEAGTAPACIHRTPRPIAVTVPGARIVGVCKPSAFGWSAVIHEMLHTLGLGENPPTPGEITFEVEKRCAASPATPAAS